MGLRKMAALVSGPCAAWLLEFQRGRPTLRFCSPAVDGFERVTVRTLDPRHQKPGPTPVSSPFESMVASQAAVMGLDDFFYASTFIFILIIPLIWITRPIKSGDSTEASAAH